MHNGDYIAMEKLFGIQTYKLQIIQMLLYVFQIIEVPSTMTSELEIGFVF